MFASEVIEELISLWDLGEIGWFFSVVMGNGGNVAVLMIGVGPVE